MKPILAVFVVVLMLSWVVGDSLRTFMGSGTTGGGKGQGQLAPSAVAVRWNGGKLTNNELGSMVMRRHLVNSLVRSVAITGEQAALEAGVEPRPLRVEPIIGPETPRQNVEEHVVFTRLIADLARQAGMRISDEAIVRYLDELGRGRVSREDMKQMIDRMPVGGGRASIKYILDALREEMLARNFLASYEYELQTVTPEERWQDWLQVNDRIVLEVAAFPAEKFLLDVPEPTDAELAAFVEQTDNFENKYKDREPQPDFLAGDMEFPSRHPGFAIPRKINVEYIEANYDKFLAKVENEITDEEIAKYYEEHKDPLFIKADTGLIDEASKEDASSGTDAAGTQEETTSEKANDAENTQQPPAGASGSDPTQPDGKRETEPDGKQSSSSHAMAKSPVRLTAFLQESAAEKAADTAASPADTGSTPRSTEAPASTPAATEAPATPPSAADTPTSGTRPAADKPKEFQPLDEVRDEIRRQLATDRVANQLKELMEKLDGEVNSEFTKYFSATLSASVDEHEPPPPTGVLADLGPLAEKNGLEHGTTGPLSFLEMRKTPVGQSFAPDARAQLCQILFGSEDLSMYQPTLTVDLLGNRYLSMKTSDTPGRVPPLAEVRDEVVRAWKLQKAAELAQKHAQDVAKRIQGSGSSLGDYFADDPSVTVVRTDPFSWRTGGEVSRITGEQRPLRLSEPDGVVAAGPEFMEFVFSLEDGQPGATLNHDHSIAYVVRVADHQLSPEELRTAYLGEVNTWPALGSMIGLHMQDATRRLVSDITQAANIHWERPHDEIPKDE